LLLAAPRSGKQLNDGLTNLLQLRPQLLENLSRNSFSFTDQTEEDVFGSDVVMAELESLAEGELEDFLGARRKRNMTGGRLLALTDDLDDLVAHGCEIDIEALQSLGCYSLTLVEQAKQDVLGADVIVVEKPRFFLG
jgi:hypothetical protein